MKDKNAAQFLFGFLISAAVVGWLYWWWRQNREVAPQPLVLNRPSPQPLARAAPPPIPAAVAAAPAARQPAVSEPDPLTRLRGVGPIYEQKLNEAGIFTFAQLAAAGPERLKEVTGVTRWDPADWIAEARKLTQG